MVMTEISPYTEIEKGVLLRHFWSGEGNLSYLVVNAPARQAFIIDPDMEILGTYLLVLDREGLTLTASIDTHTHAEHATAAPALSKLLDAAYLMNHHARSSFVTDRLQDEDLRDVAGVSVSFLHCPGHTPDLQVVRIGQHIFTGDSLFIKSCGRADLPGGDSGRQFDCLKRLEALPDETVVHPGHDYNQQLTTTIGATKQHNVRMKFQDRQEFMAFMADYYRDEEKPDDLEYYVAFNAR